MTASVNDGAPLACRWQIAGTGPDDPEWQVEVRGQAEDLLGLASVTAVAVRFDTPMGTLRGRARMTRYAVDVTRTPPAVGVLIGAGPLRRDKTPDPPPDVPPPPPPPDPVPDPPPPVDPDVTPTGR